MNDKSDALIKKTYSDNQQLFAGLNTCEWDLKLSRLNFNGAHLLDLGGGRNEERLGQFVI